jgi:hypothetical protein
MRPVQRDGQDVIYDNGTPIVLSRGERSDVTVSPVTGSTGRYPISDRVAFLVYIRNRSGERIEVSEGSFKLVASGAPARTVLAIEEEDKVRSQAAWARFAAATSAMSAGTTHSVVYTGSGNATAVVKTYDPGRARSEAAADVAAINAAEQSALADLSHMLQRNTVLPGGAVGGVVVMALPREDACVQGERPSRPVYGAGVATPAVISVPCTFTLTAEVAKDVHEFHFDEMF